MAFAALTLSTGIAAADGFSIGLSAVRADIDVNEPGLNVNGEASGMRLFGLYEFNDNFGIEAGISSFDRPNDASIPATSEVEHESYDMFAVGTLPLTEKLDVYGKAGFVSSETEVEESELSEISSSSTDLALGFGGEYDLTNRLALRAEFQWTDNPNSGAGNTMSLSGIFRFQ
ncbi:MAG: hypothetical protein DHS20C16_34430 [Phycisphaerae bacterium]|nr:MAG: hypothetical protein DHS20C16_34430 [Phycisphaerae bacterium]